MPGVVVRVLVLLALRAHALIAAVMRVAQIGGHRAEAALLRVGDGLIQRHDDGIGLGALAHGDDRLRQGQPRLRQADHLQRLGGGDGLQHGGGIGQTHVLARVRDDAPGDEPRIDARVQKAREPRERRVRVAAAQALAEGGEHVVIQRFVAADDGLLDGLLRDGERHMDGAAVVRVRGEHGQLQRAQRRAHVAVGDAGDMPRRVRVEDHVFAAEAALPVGQRALHRQQHVRLRERLELEDAAPAHDGRGHGDERILRRGADEAHHAALDGGQDGIGLGLAPAVALVQQQVRRLTVERSAVLRLLDHLAHVGHAAGDGIELHERGMRGVRDDGGERRLAAAGRAVEDGGGHAVGLDGAAQKPPRADDVALADEFVERARAHAVGQGAEHGVLLRKQILHDDLRRIKCCFYYIAAGGKGQARRRTEMKMTEIAEM